MQKPPNAIDFHKSLYKYIRGYNKHSCLWPNWKVFNPRWVTKRTNAVTLHKCQIIHFSIINDNDLTKTWMNATEHKSLFECSQWVVPHEWHYKNMKVARIWDDVLYSSSSTHPCIFFIFWHVSCVCIDCNKACVNHTPESSTTHASPTIRRTAMSMWYINMTLLDIICRGLLT